MDAQGMADLTQEFAALAADLHGEGDNAAALHRAVELSAKYVPGCACASITVVHDNVGRTIAATDDVARLADALQYELDEGPCLQAAWDDANYLMFDLDGERRWPRYAQALSRRTPVRCVLSFQLPAKDSAALNLFGLEAGAFGDESVATGALFAAHVSNVVALYEAEEQSANLRTALGLEPADRRGGRDPDGASPDLAGRRVRAAPVGKPNPAAQVARRGRAGRRDRRAAARRAVGARRPVRPDADRVVDRRANVLPY